MTIKTIATAAITLDALYDDYGVDIWWLDEFGSGGHLEWHPAGNPTITGREIDPETGEVIDNGEWDLDEAEDMIRALGYELVGTWSRDDMGDSTQPWVEIAKA